ncbi:4-(cytidine 5'-diphospho)-2-C-methyl-D-erythritol kinase [Parapedobacter indicus]|uniref:4-diphosphocytidyl-2-C-methyl-D-erythritol kinase n=1 Tax=Parapedobacter indicus TaxID=1477437 RepID=A0A1I3DJ62_9SPHI|nr:4-(cytidine 5'-diphospho)-2-C-methyl-D-erythritol kinase [Parapedobacter indicus]PPL04705.1 4-diphosphocytidyl-2-C-methyl-D-erythritol kinase [Parapedobacter indicus]SFH86802.1 4-diphosphocytidyl-2-C-methyl-D-erythritol kinase [Parapedobacter indicus]
MIAFANAKINIGLQVLSRREDGYHQLETVFYPLKMYDVLEVVEATDTRFIPSGIPIPGDAKDNLCLRAYRLLAEAYDLPPVCIYLHKTIPIGAGLGGGSADAAFLLTLLNDKFELGLAESQLLGYARRLGADCAFFIRNTPVLATGIGDVFEDIEVDLSGYHVVVVKPPVHVSTAEAYRAVTPDPASRQLKSAISHPVATWRDAIVNDFEAGIFAVHPVIATIKENLYQSGALFASMSGSGSAVYGLFNKSVQLTELEVDNKVFYIE